MIFTIFDSITKAHIYDMRDVVDMSWDDCSQLFMTHQQADKKTDVKMFNLALFKPIGDQTAELGRKYRWLNNEKTGEYDDIPYTIRRCKSNVVAISGIVLDIDKDFTVEQAITDYDGLEYVLYTTFNHTMEKHKFRMIIPFSRLLMAEDIAGREADIKRTFPGVDQSCFTMSQSFYLHSGHTDPIVYRNEGKMIDPYTFEVAPVEVVVCQQRTDDYEVTAEYKDKVIRALESCSGLGYRGHGDGGVLTLVAICRSIDLSFVEYDRICANIAGSDSQLQQKACRKTAWDNCEYERITKVKRDRFIKDYGGRAIPDNSPHGRLEDFGARMAEKYKQFKD